MHSWILDSKVGKALGVWALQSATFHDLLFSSDFL